ncbi:hypothetical protein LX32DRAFT_192071 [Colletotrichum zoysiae]|uniref:Uncharacterized protein n=1 Tax=Colletotrichum zoysiae TaxID=1216348 RepID=A0AAD9LVB8_9PEZI|nr:hypothetical protein LX32DRAFT_192071 [Colletotrichum zoysiae]
MKPSTLLYAMRFAQLVLAFPTPAIISTMASHAWGEACSRIRTTRMPMRHTPPVSSVKDVEEYLGQKTEFEFDNRPVSPPEHMQPSFAVAAPRPLKTTYLQSLSTQL